MPLAACASSSARRDLRASTSLESVGIVSAFFAITNTSKRRRQTSGRLVIQKGHAAGCQPPRACPHEKQNPRGTTKGSKNTLRSSANDWTGSKDLHRVPIHKWSLRESLQFEWPRRRRRFRSAAIPEIMLWPALLGGS